ncbi:MAG TPA: hypothetical protein VMZ05_00135 [Spirochaetota bacterium]|nr:hypothetical protein [Spirochaetota bacterium]
MKTIFIVLLSVAVVAVSGCATIELPKSAAKQKAPGAAAEQEEKRARASVLEFEQREAEKIVKAIEYALSLELVVWDNREHMTSRDDVLGIFRKGFCSVKAQELTDYVWIEAYDRDGKKIYMLNPGEPVLSVPDSIEVVEHNDSEAQAFLIYEENLEGPVVWSDHTIVTTLKREDGAWKICETRIEQQDEP